MRFALLHFNHWKRMSLDLDAFEFIVPIVSPCAVLLLVVTGVGPDWAWPISSRVTLYGMARLQP